MLVLGVDPGLADLGWGLVEKQGSRLIHKAHGCIKTPAGLPLEQRLLAIHTELGLIIEQYRPHTSSVEALFFAKNVSSALPVAHARGVIYLTMALAGIPVFEYTPLVIKQAVLGSGTADKKQVQAMVKLLLGLPEPPRPDHAADALAAAICHIHTGGIHVQQHTGRL